MSANHTLTAFDPAKIARYEKENYVAYYQKRWLKLLRVAVGAGAGDLPAHTLASHPGGISGSPAEIAFAPFPDNDVPRAEAFMRRFFTSVERIHHLNMDVEQAATAERYWVERTSQAVRRSSKPGAGGRYHSRLCAGIPN